MRRAGAIVGAVIDLLNAAVAPGMTTLDLDKIAYKEITRQGAIAGMLTGFLTTLIWKATGLSESVIYELVPAFLFATLAIYFVSKVTR